MSIQIKYNQSDNTFTIRYGSNLFDWVALDADTSIEDVYNTVNERIEEIPN